MSTPAPPSILDRLKARASQLESGRVQTAEPNPVSLGTRGTPAPIEGQPSVDPAASLARSLTPAPLMVQTAFWAAPVEPGNQPAEGQVIVHPGQINPPEKGAPIEDSPAAETPSEAPAEKRKRRTKAEMEAARALESTSQGHTLIVAPEAPKSEVAAPSGTSIQVVSSPQAALEAGIASAKAGEIRPFTEIKPIPVLFVNCFPLAGTYVQASSLASKANEKICADQNVPDYRFLQYGAGPGALRHAVMEMIDGAENCPPVMVDTSTPEGSALVTDLEARAEQTIRGIR